MKSTPKNNHIYYIYYILFYYKTVFIDLELRLIKKK